MEWILDYQKHIEGEIEKFLHEQYPEPLTPDKKTFLEALLFAIKAGKPNRIHPILSMIVYEELLWLTAEAGLFAFIGLELIHIWFWLHSEIVDTQKARPLFAKHDMIAAYGEPMTLLVWDALMNYGIDCLSRSGKMTIIREVLNAINAKWMVDGMMQELLVDYAHYTEKEYISIHDEADARLMSASLVIWGFFAGETPEVMIDQLRRFGLFLARSHQIWADVALYMDHLQKWIPHQPNQYGVVDFLGIEKSKELLEKLRAELISITTNFQSSKFEDVVHAFLEWTM